MNIINLIIENENIRWIFSGIGVVIVVTLIHFIIWLVKQKNRKKSTLTLLKIRDDGRVYVIEWDRNNNSAVEYRPTNPVRRWRAIVSLDNDKLTIDVPRSNKDPLNKDDKLLYPKYRIVATKEVTRDDGVRFIGKENDREFMIYSMTGDFT